jgi:hypothetical protein
MACMKAGTRTENVPLSTVSANQPFSHACCYYRNALGQFDLLSGLVVRVLGYRSGGPGSIPGTTRKVVGLERGPLSLVSTTEELLDRK